MSKRKVTYPIDNIFIKRWSPRAMSGQPVSKKELMQLFEAARWAPSSYNTQQWRFIYAHRETKHWEKFFNLLVPFNQSWAKNAGALIVIISKKTFEFNNKSSRTHSFDTGAAWMSMALEGSINGLVVHGMEGFDYERAQKELDIPEDFQVEAMCAVGKPGKVRDLPAELQDKEEPSDRKLLQEIIFEGSFKSK
ncbi:MAG: nitroreductase family protein [bacterium]